VTIVDSLNQLWNTILQTIALFVIPDWNAIIGLLPILIFLGIVGPLMTLLPLGILIYQVRKPRVKGVKFEEGPREAVVGADGRPIFPPGLPHCRRDALVCGLAIPTGRLSVVLWDALAVVVEHAEVGLRRRVLLIGGLAIPQRGLLDVSRDALTERVQHAKVELGSGITLVRRLSKPRGRTRIVPRDALPLVVELAEH